MSILSNEIRFKKSKYQDWEKIKKQSYLPNHDLYDAFCKPDYFAST